MLRISKVCSLSFNPRIYTYHHLLICTSKHTIFSFFTSYLDICTRDLRIFTSAHIIFTSPLLASTHLQRFRSTRIILTFFIFACFHISIFTSSSSLSLYHALVFLRLGFIGQTISYIHFSLYPQNAQKGHPSSFSSFFSEKYALPQFWNWNSRQTPCLTDLAFLSHRR